MQAAEDSGMAQLLDLLDGVVIQVLTLTCRAVWAPEAQLRSMHQVSPDLYRVSTIFSLYCPSSSRTETGRQAGIASNCPFSKTMEAPRFVFGAA